MQRNHNYVAPAIEGEPVRKMFNGKDLLAYPGDVPSQYGRNIARALWSKDELITQIMSPGKDLEFMQAPRSPMTPTRKALFRGEPWKLTDLCHVKFSSFSSTYTFPNF